MFLVLDIDKYNSENIFITESIRNTVIDNSSFIRIIYSTPHVILNGIILETPFNDFQINKYFNKWRCNYSAENNEKIIQNIQELEKGILEKVNIEHKEPCYKIHEQLCNNYIKIFLEDTAIESVSERSKILLKISGIWVSEHEYGITYKFLLAH